MTHTTENYGDVSNFSEVTYVMPFMNLKFVGTWAPAVKIIGDIPDVIVLNVPKAQSQHNPDGLLPLKVLVLSRQQAIDWANGDPDHMMWLYFWNIFQTFIGTNCSHHL